MDENGGRSNVDSMLALRTRPPLTEVSRALRMPKKSRKCLPGPPAPEPRKVSKKSREQSEKSPESVALGTFRTVPETFWRLFGVPGPKGPKIEKNQSRLKISISIENFNPGPSEFPTKTRGLVGGSLEIFNLD